MTAWTMPLTHCAICRWAHSGGVSCNSWQHMLDSQLSCALEGRNVECTIPLHIVGLASTLAESSALGLVPYPGRFVHDEV